MLTGSTSNNGVDPWNMSSVDQALGANTRKKSPQEFLGANAGLVNLDDLVSRAPQKGEYLVWLVSSPVAFDCVPDP